MKKATSKANGAGGKKDIAASYNRFKTYKGKQYSGMKVGGHHKWYYDAGVWTDKKITPEKWEIHFEVNKRRAGKAPEGSGAPVGTEYHWYVLAHQVVKKLDANTYSTEMTGVKYKLAHKRAAKDKWNISDKTQRKHLIKILNDFILELEQKPAETLPASDGRAMPAKKTSSPKKRVKKEVEEPEMA